MNRRRLIKASAGAGAGFWIATQLGTPLVKAQAARFELKVIQEPEMSTVLGSTAYFGSFMSMSNNGTIVGNLTVSEDKVTPCIWKIDGKRTKLKTGEFGGNATVATDSGLVAGYTYGVRFGDVNNTWNEDVSPAIWMNEVPTDIALPENALGTGRIDAMNGDGVGFGWIDMHNVEFDYDSNERAFFAENAAIVPPDNLDAPSFSPARVGASGTMAGTVSVSVPTETGSTSYSAPATLSGDTVTVLPFPPDFPEPETGTDLFPSVNPAGITADDRAVFWFSKTIDAITESRLYRYDDEVPVEIKSGVPELVHLTASAVSQSGIILAFGDSVDRLTDARLVITADESIPLDEATVTNDTPVTGYTFSGVNDDGVLVGNGYDVDGNWYGIMLLPV